MLSARMKNGMQGSICGAQGVQYGYDARCEILGEKGLITVGSLAAAAGDHPQRRPAARRRSCGVGPTCSWTPIGPRTRISCAASGRTARRGPADGRQGRGDGRQCGKPLHRRAPARAARRGRSGRAMSTSGSMLAATYPQGGAFAIRERPDPARSAATACCCGSARRRSAAPT